MTDGTVQQLAQQTINSDSSKGDRHNGWMIFFHWSTVAALLIATATILLLLVVEEKTTRVVLLDIHRQAGLYVLLVLALRLVTRLTTGMRDFAVGSGLTLRVAAKIAHIGLYLTLLTLTLLGWLLNNAHAVSVKLFGLIPLPDLIADDPDVADTLADYHLWSAWVLLGMVIAHIAAACWHHWWRHDNVLAAMLPMLRHGGPKQLRL